MNLQRKEWWRQRRRRRLLPVHPGQVGVGAGRVAGAAAQPRPPQRQPRREVPPQSVVGRQVALLRPAEQARRLQAHHLEPQARAILDQCLNKNLPKAMQQKTSYSNPAIYTFYSEIHVHYASLAAFTVTSEAIVTPVASGSDKTSKLTSFSFTGKW